MVRCDSCGRETRRDKAVYIRKKIFANPVERKDVMNQDEYSAGTFREMKYCAGCGKHLRVYDKVTKNNQRNKERDALRMAFQRPAPGDLKSELQYVEGAGNDARTDAPVPKAGTGTPSA